MEKKENEVSSCLASRTQSGAPWRSVVCVCDCVCVQTLHIKITRHVNVSCKLTKRRDELEDEPNRTGREPDSTGQQGQQRHANGAGAPVT